MRKGVKMSKQHQKQMEKQYWKGFEDGRISSLNHNILLMKSQLEAIDELQKEPKHEEKRSVKDKFNDGVCKCGHHSKDHSYDPMRYDDNLYCDVCECENYKFDRFENEEKRTVDLSKIKCLDNGEYKEDYEKRSVKELHDKIGECVKDKKEVKK